MKEHRTPIKHAFDEELAYHPAPPDFAERVVRLATADPSNASIRSQTVAVGAIAVLLAAVIVVTLTVGIRGLTNSDSRGATNQRPGPAPTAIPFVSTQIIEPTSESTVWALTGQTLQRTTDGGVSWRVVFKGHGMLSPVGAFIDEQHAWIVVADARSTLVWRTSDGGQTWQSTPIATVAGTAPTQLFFLDPQYGWLLASTGAAAGSQGASLWRTENGGLNWTLVALGSGSPEAGTIPFGCEKSGISFVTPERGWLTGRCSGGYAFLFMTSDAGVTWQRQPLPSSATGSTGQLSGNVSVSAPRFFGLTEVVLIVQPPAATPASQSVLFYVSHDGGLTWSMRGPSPVAGYGADVVSPMIWFVVAGNTCLVTSDGGESWQRIQPNRDLKDLTQIVFASTRVAWALQATGAGSVLLYSSDAGRTWEARQLAAEG